MEVNGEKSLGHLPPLAWATGLVMVPMAVNGMPGGRAGVSVKNMAPVWTST